MKESKLERDSTDLAIAMNWLYYKGKGRNGASDKVFLKAGRGFVVEFKTKTGVQSPAQKVEGECCARRGISRYVVRTLQQMQKVLLIEEAKFKPEDLASMNMEN